MTPKFELARQIYFLVIIAELTAINNLRSSIITPLVPPTAIKSPVIVSERVRN